MLVELHLACLCLSPDVDENYCKRNDANHEDQKAIDDPGIGMKELLKRFFHGVGD